MKTLISFIGKGQVPQEAKEAKEYYYRKTTYDFGGGITYETTCFPDAIRLSGKFEFDEVKLIGTYTSSWSTLLESDSNSEGLWLNLKEKEEKNLPLCTEDEELLRDTLETLWRKKVVLYINEQELREDNCEELLHRYMGILLDSGSNILLDITHGYRWMPILLTSVLQLPDSYKGIGTEKRIEILYGELGGKVSPVRKLDILTKGQEISDAVALFFQKFEAEPLAKLLGPHWEKGSGVIKKIGGCIQSNYFLPLLIDESKDFPRSKIIIDLEKELKNFSEKGKPAWVIEVKKHLEKISAQLNKAEPRARLLNLAQLLADRKLYGQAAMALCLAMEQDLMSAAEYYKHPGYGRFTQMQDQVIAILKDKSMPVADCWAGERNLFNYLTSLDSETRKKLQECFDKIKHLRNRVAHGAQGEDISDIKELKTEFDKTKKMEEEFHKILEGIK